MPDQWYAVVDASGTLISTGTVIADAESLAAQGYSSISLPGDPTGNIWNATSKTFSAPPPPPTVLSTWQWLQRFTPLEYGSVAASTDPQVKMFLLMATTAATVNPTDPVVLGGLAYLQAVNILTADRAAAIGSA